MRTDDSPDGRLPTALGDPISTSITIPYHRGVYLAANAVPDVYLVFDGHDCGHYKVQEIVDHDGRSDLLRWGGMNRATISNLDLPDYVMGGEDKLSSKILQIATRHDAALILVVRSNIIAVAGGQDAGVIAELRRKVAVPIADLPLRNLGADHVTGYFDVVEALVRQLDFDASHAARGIWTYGLFLHRTEGDQLADVAELRRLLRGLSLEPGPTLLDGSSFASLCGRPPPAGVISLRGSATAGARLAERTGCPHVSLPVPIGLQATVSWLEELGRAFGVEEAARGFVEQQLGALLPDLQWLLPRYFIGRRVLVFADRYTLGPLVSFFEELGMVVGAVGVLSAAERGVRRGEPVGLDEERVPFVAMDQRSLERRFEAEARTAEISLVVGNGIVFQIAARYGLPVVQLGYPTSSWHALTPRPILGFAGVRVLVERAVNAIGEAEQRHLR